MLTTAAAAFFLVQLVRSFRWVKVKMIDGVKPFACDLCMSFWCAAAVAGWRAPWFEALAGAGLCLLVLTVLRRIPELFPSRLDN